VYNTVMDETINSGGNTENSKDSPSAPSPFAFNTLSYLQFIEGTSRQLNRVRLLDMK